MDASERTNLAALATPPKSKRVMLVMPAGPGTAEISTAHRFFHPFAQGEQPFELLHGYTGGSALANTFNRLWSEGLGMYLRYGVTHFAMLHADVRPDEGWLQTLMEELERTGADVISAVSAIKDSHGVTSTGLGNPDDPWSYKRLTLSELAAFPQTFDATDLGHPDDVLLVNTGCWLADLRRPWWLKQKPNGELLFCFTQQDRILYFPEREKHLFEIEFLPEDWWFSRLCHQVGAKVKATRKVNCIHYGRNLWPADHAWGDWDFDAGPAYMPAERVSPAPIEDESGSLIGEAQLVEV